VSRSNKRRHRHRKSKKPLQCVVRIKVKDNDEKDSEEEEEEDEEANGYDGNDSQTEIVANEAAKAEAITHLTDLTFASTRDFLDPLSFDPASNYHADGHKTFAGVDGDVRAALRGSHARCGCCGRVGAAIRRLVPRSGGYSAAQRNVLVGLKQAREPPVLLTSGFACRATLSGSEPSSNAY
jgi:hypothetical protein